MARQVIRVIYRDRAIDQVHGVSRKEMWDGIRKGFLLWRDNSEANIDFKFVESGGWDYEVRPKELWAGPNYRMPDGSLSNCAHFGGWAKYGSRTINIHNNWVSPSHTCRIPKPTEGYVWMKTRAPNIYWVIAHEWGHAALRLRHTSSKTCIMHPGSPNGTLCTLEKNVIKGKYGKTNDPLPDIPSVPTDVPVVNEPPVPFGTKLKRMDIIVSSGTFQTIDGVSFEADNNAVTVTGGVFRKWAASPPTIRAMPMAAEMEVDVPCNEHSEDGGCVCGFEQAN